MPYDHAGHRRQAAWARTAQHTQMGSASSSPLHTNTHRRSSNLSLSPCPGTHMWFGALLSIIAPWLPAQHLLKVHSGNIWNGIKDIKLTDPPMEVGLLSVHRADTEWGGSICLLPPSYPLSAPLPWRGPFCSCKERSLFRSIQSLVSFPKTLIGISTTKTFLTRQSWYSTSGCCTKTSK